MAASTIVVARQDLSIPGAADDDSIATCTLAEIEARFFNVVRQYNPDVVVLDFTGSHEQAISAILKVRRRTAVPILVVCLRDDPMMREYCLAGAAECIEAPVDIIQLNVTVQKIIQLSKATRGAVEQIQTQSVVFSGITLHSRQNLLVGPDGMAIKLTTSENRLLQYFVSNPWTLCTRDALADTLYGPRRPNSDRAVDVIVTRLRKKIVSLGGAAVQHLIKTEFRRGYIFVAEVTRGVPAAARQAEPALRARTA